MITELKKEIKNLQIGFPEQKELIEKHLLATENELDARFDKIRKLEDEKGGLESELENTKEELACIKDIDEDAILPNENLYDTQKNEVLMRMHRNLTLEELGTLEAEAKMLMRNGRQYAY